MDSALLSGLILLSCDRFKKVVGMIIRRLCLIVLPVLLAIAGCTQEGQTEEKSIESMALAGAQTQLKINQEALFRGATEEGRVDAAMVMLFNDDPRARQVFIDALKQSENKPARIAVCKALSASREARLTIKNKKDFISPLAEIFKTDDGSTAKFAAEAALLYDYEEIANVLEPMAKDSGLPVKARLNAIYALKVQFDTRAIILLAELAGDKDSQVSAAAEEALRSIGIPVGRYARNRSQIIAELRTRGLERFQREWMVRQEARVSELEKQRNQWQKLYFSALDKIYQGLTDDSQRGKLLTETLASPEEEARLWALDKVSQW
jgi:hypothetical protein